MGLREVGGLNPPSPPLDPPLCLHRPTCQWHTQIWIGITLLKCAYISYYMSPICIFKKIKKNNASSFTIFVVLPLWSFACVPFLFPAANLEVVRWPTRWWCYKLGSECFKSKYYSIIIGCKTKCWDGEEKIGKRKSELTTACLCTRTKNILWEW